MRTIGRIALLALAAALVALFIWGLSTPPKEEIGKPAPETQGPDSSGSAFRLSDYRGRVVMLDFWADW